MSKLLYFLYKFIEFLKKFAIVIKNARIKKL